jgi:hypothetical protein
VDKCDIQIDQRGVLKAVEIKGVGRRGMVIYNFSGGR